jgi:hypothetical protein
MKISARTIEIAVFLVFSFALGVYLGKSGVFQEENIIPICDICEEEIH